MSKKVIKYIVELFYIFIIPLILICATTTIYHEYVYDDNGNFESSETTFNFDNSIIKYIHDDTYINYLDLNQILHNNVSPFENIDYWVLSSNSTAEINNGNIVIDLLSASRFYQTYDLIVGHKYYYKAVIFNYNNYGQFVYNFGTTTSITLPSGQQALENIIIATDDHGSIGFYGTIDHTKIAFSYIAIIDLTKMYGNGYEPTLTDIQSNELFINTYNYIDSEIITIESDDQLSLDNRINYTIWGNIHHSFVDALDLNESPILNYVFCYIILWFIMFITWHLFYLLFDKLFHLRKE